VPGLTASSVFAEQSDADARQRASAAYKVRHESAVFHKDQPIAVETTNGDEGRYANKIGSYSKFLRHNANGEVLPESFESLRHAMTTGAPADFEAILIGGAGKLANPQAGFAFTFCGNDTQATAVPTPPAFASAETAAEMVELYWAALTRDVPFDQYATDSTVAAAAAELSTLADFRGPKAGGMVTPGTLFRAPIAGAMIGPHISQLLWKSINYGPYVVDQKLRVAVPGVDYMTDYNTWLGIQNGGAPVTQQYVGTSRRYIISGRDLTEFLHRDFSHQAGTNAVFVLGASGVGLAPGNPYLTSATQSGNFTLGQSQILDLVAAVANASLQACWYQKWSVHRRVRPEEFAGSIRNNLALGLPRPINRQVLGSQALARVLANYGSALLPMPYPEGCPSHPSYPGGHPTFAGACCTVLKAFFNNDAVMTGTVVPDATGSTLVPTALTLKAGDEIDKLASNIALGRVIAGVHWRSDEIAGLNLGEACAIAVLQDMRRTWNESFVGFAFKKFDGTPVTI
jgi:membrane-associated phospholipid phosphatase